MAFSDVLKTYERDINLEYFKAKILADPVDYTFLSRAIVLKDTCLKDALYLSDTSELSLLEAINAAAGESFTSHSCYVTESTARVNTYQALFKKALDADTGDTKGQVSKLHTCAAEDAITDGLFYTNSNNLIINENKFISFLILLNSLPTPVLDNALSNSIQNLIKSDGLKILFYMYLKCTSKTSLIPNLLYLMTTLESESFADLENLTHAKSILESKCALPYMEMFNERFHLTRYCIFPGDIAMYTKVPLVSSSIPDFFRVSTAYSFIYGCELMYWYDKAPMEIKNTFSNLFLTHARNGYAYIANLYTIDTDTMMIAPVEKLRDCFSDVPEERFNNFRTYLQDILNRIFDKDTNPESPEYECPYVLTVFTQSLHQYAVMQMRVKHCLMLYKYIKDNKIALDTSNDLSDLSSLIDGGTPSTSAATTEDFLNAALSVAYGGTTPDTGSTDIPKAENEDSKTSRASLGNLNSLVRDLEDNNGQYEYSTYNKCTETGDAERYNQIAGTVNLLCNDLIKQIKEIKTYNTGGKNSGLLTGKLDKKNLHSYRTKHKIFYNNTYKLKELDLAIGCVLDQSGSMRGRKVEDGKVTMILLHEVLQALNVNHSIIGHDSNEQMQSNIYKYFAFKEDKDYILQKPYALTTAKALCGNCDSGALKYMETMLKGVHNKDKIVIIFSDGEPTECSEDQLRVQVRNMERNGIHVIGVGINFESIKEYYPDNANGKDLKEMLDIVVSILKRYVLEKKGD